MQEAPHTRKEKETREGPPNQRPLRAGVRGGAGSQHEPKAKACRPLRGLARQRKEEPEKTPAGTRKQGSEKKNPGNPCGDSQGSEKKNLKKKPAGFFFFKTFAKKRKWSQTQACREKAYWPAARLDPRDDEKQKEKAESVIRFVIKKG